VSDAYRRAGVDLEAAARAVDLIREAAAAARTPEIAEGIGGFAGSYRLGDGRLLVAATDGAGTKCEIARHAGRLDTIGIDLVAMSANDVACTGARPLFFLDTVVVGKLLPERVAEIVSGVAEGCLRAECALLGGETAEHPGVMEPDQFDLVGFCVGLVEQDRTIGPDRVREGDVLIGLESTGLHANGYSLVRSALLDAGTYSLEEAPEELGRPLVEELLEPTAIYAPFVPTLAYEGRISAAAHVTGGGLPGNLPRALPDGLGAQVERGSWPEPPIFGLVQRAAGASDDEMFATFNMGVGMVLVVPEGNADAVVERANGKAHRIGRVVAGSGVRIAS
jgi:phosphoribosylformylglycinamidine cyclo-ligase